MRPRHGVGRRPRPHRSPVGRPCGGAGLCDFLRLDPDDLEEELPDLAESIDVTTGIIMNITKHKTYTAVPFPEFMQKIIDADGLINYIKQEVDLK